LSKSPDHTCESLFLDFDLYISLLMPAPGCLDYCSSVINFKIGILESSDLILFKIVLAILSAFHVHVNFMISLSISAKKPDAIRIRIVLYL
jgi:hypothetical protein